MNQVLNYPSTVLMALHLIDQNNKRAREYSKKLSDRRKEEGRKQAKPGPNNATGLEGEEK